MAANDEDGNVNADDNQAEAREMDQRSEEMVSSLLRSEETSNEQGTSTNLLLGESSSNQPSSSGIILPDDKDVTLPIDYTSSEYDETRLRNRFSLLHTENDDESKELSKIGSSSSDHLEAEHVQYGTHEPVNQPMPTRQSITTTTASSSGRRPSVTMTKALLTSTDFVPKRNQQAMNLPHTQRNPQGMNRPQTQRNPQAMNPRLQVPPGQYGNITRPSYLPPSARPLPFQQHGGSNMAHDGTMVTPPYWRLEQNDINNMPPLGPFMVPPGTVVTPSYWRPEQNDINNMPPLGPFMVPPGTVVTPPYWRPQQNDINNVPQFDALMVPYVVTIVPYPYPSANPANSRFGYEAGGPSNHLPSMQHHQGGDLTAWRPDEQNRQYWEDIRASVNPQDDRSDDPSDQTQQRSPPRDN